MNCFYCQEKVVNGYEICDKCFYDNESKVLSDIEQRPVSPVPCFYCNGKVLNGYEICDECFYVEEQKAIETEKEMKEILDRLEPVYECVGCLGQSEVKLQDGVCDLCRHLSLVSLLCIEA